MPNENDTNWTKEKIKQIIDTFLQEEFEVEKSRIIPGADLKSTSGLDIPDYVD